MASTLLENGGIPISVSTSSLLKEAIHVISCGYEDKTDWGKEVSCVFYEKIAKLVRYLLGVGDFSPVRINFSIKSYTFLNDAIILYIVKIVGFLHVQLM